MLKSLNKKKINQWIDGERKKGQKKKKTQQTKTKTKKSPDSFRKFWQRSRKQAQQRALKVSTALPSGALSLAT